MSDKDASLRLKILDKACEGSQPYHAIREAVQDATSRAALALHDGKTGAVADALRDLRAAEGAREDLVSIGGPEAIVRAGKARDKREWQAEQKELAAKREAQEKAHKTRVENASKKKTPGGIRPNLGSGAKRTSISKKSSSSRKDPRPKGMIKPKKS